MSEADVTAGEKMSVCPRRKFSIQEVEYGVVAPGVG